VGTLQNLLNLSDADGSGTIDAAEFDRQVWILYNPYLSPRELHGGRYGL
jgi:hypothetical protein